MERRAAGIYGYWGRRDGSNPEAALARMISTAGRAADEVSKRVGDDWAVCVSPCFGEADIYAEDNCVAAIHGRWRWRRPADRETVAHLGDASLLLHLWREQKLDIEASLGGQFALAIFEARSGKGVLAVDRMGIEPMAYHISPAAGCVFASDADAIAADPTVGRDLSDAAICQFLHFYRVPSPRTIFNKVSKLPPGAEARVADGAAALHTYWNMPYRSENPAEVADLQASLRDTTREAVRRSLEGIGSEETGTFLSGGLDSSTVTGMVARVEGSAKSFTIGFNEEGYDESGWARIAARHFDTRHHEYFVTPEDIPDVVGDLIAGYDEPYGNSSILPTYFCARTAAAEGIAHMIAGDGGDELFAGNERYVTLSRFDVYGRIPSLLRHALIEPILDLPGAHRIPILRRARNLRRGYGMSMAERMLASSAIFEYALDRVFQPRVAATLNSGDLAETLTAAFNRHHAGDDIQRMMGLDLSLTIADSDLRKVNRMCHMAGVDVRYPMLDDAMVDLAAAIPSGTLLPGGRLRGFFKDSFSDFLPAEILDKPKQGFGLPFYAWVARPGRLNQFFRDHLSDFGKRGLLTPAFLQDLESSCGEGGDLSHRTHVWDVVALEIWLTHHAPTAGWSP